MSKECQRLEQKDPSENCKAGEGAAVDDAVARQLRVRLHLLCHGEAGNGAGCGKHSDKCHKLDPPKAKHDRKREHDARYNDETGGNREDELAQMCLIASTVKGCAEDDECNGRGRRRNLRNWLQHGRRNRQLHEAAQRTRNRPQDHGVHEYAAQDRQEVEPSAAKGLEHEHAEYIVERNDDRNHHGWNRNRRIAEDVGDKGDAHEDVVAAKARLDHRAAPCIVGLKTADNTGKDKCCEQHAARTEEHEPRLKRRPRIGYVDVVEHHKEEEYAKHHAVDMQEFFLREKTRSLHKHADCHQAKKGNNTAKRNKKIAEHKNAPPPRSVL